MPTDLQPGPATGALVGSTDPMAGARRVAERHAALLRESLGGRVHAVWLVGSAALGDLQPGSDIDTVTLTDRPLDAGDEATATALGEVHRRLAAELPGVRYDTTYLDRAGLALPPVPGTVTPFSLDGELRLGQACAEVHAVTWWTLPHAVPVSGPAPDQVDIAADRAAAVQHSRDNLRTYWAGVADQITAATADRDPDGPADAEVVVWTVLGAPRLAMFAAGMPCQGPIPSKTEAGRWVARTRPEHAALARRAVAHRLGEAQTFTVADARQAARLTAELVAEHGSRPAAAVGVAR